MELERLLPAASPAHRSRALAPRHSLPGTRSLMPPRMRTTAQVSGPPFKMTEQVRRATPASSDVVDHMLTSVHLRTLKGVDPDPSALPAACVFHCGTPPTARQVPCMVRIETDRVAHLAFAVTVATADGTVTDALKTELCQLLAQL